MMTDEEMGKLRNLLAWHSEQVSELEGVEGEETAFAFHREAVTCLLIAMLTLRGEGRNGLQGRN